MLLTVTGALCVLVLGTGVAQANQFIAKAGETRRR
jgi:hypothetical protein